MLFYAKPATQFEYFVQVIGVEVSEDIKSRWIELKATRDLLVHNSGKINELYLNKSNSSARGALGDIVTIDKEYFEGSISTVKALVGKISSQLQAALSPKAKPARA